MYNLNVYNQKLEKVKSYISNNYKNLDRFLFNPNDKDKGKNVKLRYQLNIIKNFIRHLPNKSEHEVVFKKNCQRVIQWLFFTIKE